MTSSTGLLSVVVPVLNEAPNIAPLCAEIGDLGGCDFEVIFVDDGSSDGTWDAIRDANGRDPRFRGVRLRTNSGKSAAYAAGFNAARGDIVATLDGDLQDDPGDLGRLVEQVHRGTDLVVGWKKTGKSTPVKFALSKIGNLMLRFVTPLRLHDMNCPVRAMRREVAGALDLRADHHRYIPLLAHARGFSVSELPVANRPRQHGQSKYGGSKYVKSATALLGMGLYLRFGERPMLLFGGLGIAGLLIGVTICATVTTCWAFFGSNIDDDIPTLILGAVFILTGMQFLGLGLLGEMIVRRLRLSEGTGAAEVTEEL
ncbi:MAG: glycosyltransferase [Planctomycetes bacterium]|nr:glycosyltransferase [Planctomycetota bacterium]